MIELSGGEEGLIGGSRPAAKVDGDDSLTLGKG